MLLAASHGVRPDTRVRRRPDVSQGLTYHLLRWPLLVRACFHTILPDLDGTSRSSYIGRALPGRVHRIRRLPIRPSAGQPLRMARCVARQEEEDP
jgi:hypothetical protein